MGARSDPHGRGRLAWVWIVDSPANRFPATAAAATATDHYPSAHWNNDLPLVEGSDADAYFNIFRHGGSSGCAGNSSQMLV